MSRILNISENIDAILTAVALCAVVIGLLGVLGWILLAESSSEAQAKQINQLKTESIEKKEDSRGWGNVGCILLGKGLLVRDNSTNHIYPLGRRRLGVFDTFDPSGAKLTGIITLPKKAIVRINGVETNCYLWDTGSADFSSPYKELGWVSISEYKNRYQTCKYTSALAPIPGSIELPQSTPWRLVQMFNPTVENIN